MIPEERALKEFVRAAIQNDCDKPTVMRMIRAFRRACYEDAARVVESEMGVDKGDPASWNNEMLSRIATAIRKKGGVGMTIGDTHDVYGRVAAVGITDGEKYYWFVDKHGTVSMIPAIVIDTIHNPPDEG